jgi:hypothetical protein
VPIIGLTERYVTEMGDCHAKCEIAFYTLTMMTPPVLCSVFSFWHRNGTWVYYAHPGCLGSLIPFRPYRNRPASATREGTGGAGVEPCLLRKGCREVSIVRFSTKSQGLLPDDLILPLPFPLFHPPRPRRVHPVACRPLTSLCAYTRSLRPDTSIPIQFPRRY